MKNVLLVEDSNAFAGMLSQYLLKEHDIQCVLAASKAAAMTILQQRQDFFAAVVDLHLPDAPEGEVIDVILPYKIPTVVFTGDFSEYLREDFADKQIADYVIKQGPHSISYVGGILERLYLNRDTTVLVVDDSIIARRKIKKLLEIQRFNVLEAQSGEEALSVLAEHPDVSLALIDCVMDDMDGYKLCVEIRKKYPQDSLALIGISSSGGQLRSAQFIKSGANDFLLKPFLQEEFFCRVNQNIAMVERIRKLKQLDEQKDCLLAMAAHDIRSPLGGVIGLCQLLMTEQYEQSVIDEFISTMHQSCCQMMVLLNDLLDISALNSSKISIKYESIELAGLVQQQLKLHQLVAQKKGIAIQCVIDSVPQIKADPNRLKQVIDNFISNAIKFSKSGSQVHVTLSQKNNQITFAVTDTGPGISQNEQEMVFLPFQKVSNQPTAGEYSSGLGLAICKSIIEAHEGKIGLQSEPGRGSRFYFQLPVAT